jgi:hypothetical protein
MMIRCFANSCHMTIAFTLFNSDLLLSFYLSLLYAVISLILPWNGSRITLKT